MPLDIRLSTVDEMVAEAAPHLIGEHWCESGDGEPLSIAWSRFRALEEAEALLILAARIDGQMVGYSVNLIIPHSHTGTVVGDNHALFVAKASRATGAGLELIRATEREVARRGARFMVWRSKVGSSLDRMMGSMGREEYEHAYRVGVTA